MMTLDELRNRREILTSIDWELTPQAAFQKYQVKSINSWKYRNLEETYHFYIDVWQGKAKLFLMKRGLKSAEDVAEIDVPEKLLRPCLVKQAGNPPLRGQYPIDSAIKEWLREQLKA